MKKCPFCGASIEESARFCLYCMHPLNEKEQILPYQKKNKRSMFIFIGIIVVFTILAFILFGGDNASNDQNVAYDSTIADSSITESEFSENEVIFSSSSYAESNEQSSDDDSSDEADSDSDQSSEMSESSDSESSSEQIHTHRFSIGNTDSKYIKSEATCTVPAEYYYSCSCGEKGSSTFLYGSLSPHVTETDLGHPATCVTTGLTDGEHCSVCGIVIIAQTKTPLINHTFDGDRDDTCNVCNYVRVLDCPHTKTVVLESVKPTCISSGKTEGLTCSLCESILVEQLILAPLGHTEVTDPAVNPTCTTNGKTEGKHCSVCKIVLVYQQNILALGHDFDSSDPTSPCSLCGAEPPHTHSYTEENIDPKYQKEAATCVTRAVFYYSCSCGAKGTNTFYYGKTVPHTTVIVKGYAAGCTTDGLSDGSYCSVCNEVFELQYPIKATGHTFEPGDSLPSCLLCGDIGTVIVTAPELPFVQINQYSRFRIDGVTYSIKRDTLEEKWVIHFTVSYTNISSEATMLCPILSVYYKNNGYDTGHSVGCDGHTGLEPGESGISYMFARIPIRDSIYELVFKGNMQ